MSTVQQTTNHRMRVIWLAVVLALRAAVMFSPDGLATKAAQ